MKYLLKVCLVALTLAATMVPSLAAGPPGATPVGQELRAGISVELVDSRSAVPMPEADYAGSMIVTLTRNGDAFWGVNPVGPVALAESIKAQRSRKAGQRVYIKADARGHYANAVKVFDAIRAAVGESAVLLTGLRGTPKPRTPVPPYGLVVLVGPQSGDGSLGTVVQLLEPVRESPRLELNDKPMPWGELQSSMRKALQSRKTKLAIVKAEGNLPYADVVQVIDTCQSLGAKVALGLQEQ